MAVDLVTSASPLTAGQLAAGGVPAEAGLDVAGLAPHPVPAVVGVVAIAALLAGGVIAAVERVRWGPRPKR